MLHEFCKANAQIKRKPFSPPRIQDTIHKITKIDWATCVDLNMTFYGMKLSKRARKIGTIVTLWGLYEYLSMPMGIIMTIDVFQTRLAWLFTHISHVLLYIDNITIIGYTQIEEHLADVDGFLDILYESGMQVNPVKCICAKDKIEYLGFILTTQGVKPQPKKIKQIQAILPPKNKTNLPIYQHYKLVQGHVCTARAHPSSPHLNGWHQIQMDLAERTTSRF